MEDFGHKRAVPLTGETWVVNDHMFKGLGQHVWIVAFVMSEPGIIGTRLAAGDILTTVGPPQIPSGRVASFHVPLLMCGKLVWISLDHWCRMDMQMLGPCMPHA